MYPSFYFHKIFLHAAKCDSKISIVGNLVTKFCCNKYGFTLHDKNENKDTYYRSKKIVKTC